MSLQAQTNMLVNIVRGFNQPLAIELDKAIGAERSSHYYARRNLMVELEELQRDAERREERGLSETKAED